MSVRRGEGGRRGDPRDWVGHAVGALTREAPLLAGIAVGVGYAWHNGRAFVFDGRFAGYRWPDYIFNAWMIDREYPAMYNAFRYPLHGAAVAALGEWMGSYADAATLVSSLAVVAMCIGAGLGARALATPWAGGLAAATVTTCVPVADAARWSNLYPQLAGASALAVGLAAVLARWPSVPVALAAGVTACLAWATDARGLPIAMFVIPFAALGALRAGASSRARAALILLAFALPLVAAPRLAVGWGVDTRRQLNTTSYLDVQRGVVHHWTQHSNDDAMAAACRAVPPARMLRLDTLRTPCAARMLAHNLRATLPRQVPFAHIGALWLLVLFLPDRRGVSGVVDRALYMVGVLGLALGASAFMPLPERYVLQFAAPLAVLVPVAWGRLAGLGGFVGQAALFVWGVQHAAAVAPTRAFPPVGTRGEASYEAWNLAGEVARARIPEGASYLDCSLHNTNLALLPRDTWPYDPVGNWGVTMTPDLHDACAAWIADPAAGRWVAVGLAPPGQPRVDPEPRVADLLARVRADPRWAFEARAGEAALFRWSGAAPAPP